ncbi:MAG: class I SAM-dependent methyltransferase [Deltaproteobacteria bacterium]|nr:class I SAM-dependent methyltransferase [Deltaproteobacteria bacterium]
MTEATGAHAEMMEQVPCPACGADRPRVWGRVPHDRYLAALDIRPPRTARVLCVACGFLYTTPQPTAEALARLYASLYRSTALGYESDAPSEAYLALKRQKAEHDYQWFLRALPHPIPPGDVLEIGCAEGLLLACFAETGWRTLGLEPTRAYAAYARTHLGLEVLEGFVETLVALDRRFDVVVALGVLEHIKHPRSMLAKVSAVLNPEGFCYLQVPNAERPGANPDVFCAPHLSAFTADSFQAFMARAGWAVAQLEAEATSIYALVRPGLAELVPAVDNLDARYRRLRAGFRRYRIRCFARRIVDSLRYRAAVAWRRVGRGRRGSS